MGTVTLTLEEWQGIIDCMLYAPGRECNRYINKITTQVGRAAQIPQSTSGIPGDGQLGKDNSRELQQ